MRAVLVMFDTLNRRYLPAYGGDEPLPNFERLAARSVTFDRAYAGSMPCMPARREMHTGRPNFLHRSWGPLEPFDDSVPALLGAGGIYTHLVTDHKHYWGDGGATYHGRFTSYEFFRGQEGDAWKGRVRDPDPLPGGTRPDAIGRQDLVNRTYTAEEGRHPQTLTFDAGLEFIWDNRGDDDWFLQIETFDPHEPFTASARYRHGAASTPATDWPVYRRVTDEDAEGGSAAFVGAYRALLRQCDNSLGRVLDAFDEADLWRDTMLIVCTDHGLLLGEHEWWGKMVQPWYEENIHVPLFVWDPRVPSASGTRSGELVQTIDLGPTLLEFFGLPSTEDMLGEPIGPIISEAARGHAVALFGNHGGHVSITDGRYVYMRASATPFNQPLNEYTLMPMRLLGPFSQAELSGAELHPPLAFTKSTPVLRVPTVSAGSPWVFGTLLYDLEADPGQNHPIDDDALELAMIRLLVEAMRAADAPPEQFERLGLPADGDVGPEHLLVGAQRAQRERGGVAAPRAVMFDADAPVVALSVQELLSDPRTRPIVIETMPFLEGPFVARLAASMTLVEAAALGAGVGNEELERLDDELRTRLVALT